MKKLELPYWYMVIQLDYDVESLSYSLTTLHLEVIFKTPLKSLFGEVASAQPLKVLKFDPVTKKALVRVVKMNYAKFRAALALLSSASIGGKVIAIVAGVLCASPCLLSLSAPFNPQRCFPPRKSVAQ